MIRSLLAAASTEIAATRRKAVRLAIGVVIALAAIIVMMVALLNALFTVVASQHGPVVGYLVVACAGFVVALVGAAIAFHRERPRPPDPTVAAVMNATDGAAQAFSAATQVFQTAMAAGQAVRAMGKNAASEVKSKVQAAADDVTEGVEQAADAAADTARPEPRVSGKLLANAALVALIAGIVAGRKL